MKYVMFLSEHGQRIPVIFPDELTHNRVSDAISSMYRGVHRANLTPVSAGNIELGRVACNGGSTTLKLKADLDDAEVINQYRYLHGL